jgi:hypothetical protein
VKKRFPKQVGMIQAAKVISYYFLNVVCINPKQPKQPKQWHNFVHSVAPLENLPGERKKSFPGQDFASANLPRKLVRQHPKSGQAKKARITTTTTPDKNPGGRLAQTTPDSGSFRARLAQFDFNLNPNQI